MDSYWDDVMDGDGMFYSRSYAEDDDYQRKSYSYGAGYIMIPESNLHVELAFADGIHEIDLGNSRTYLHPVPRLEDMAIVAIAVPLRDTYQRIQDKTTFCGYATRERRIRKMNEVVDQLNLPKSLLNKIKPVCYKLTHEDRDTSSIIYTLQDMCKCIENNEKKPFWRRWKGIVYNPNGSIDFTRTILKVLSCPNKCGRGTDSMFAILSTYCMEKYLNEFPITSLSEGFVQKAIQDRYNSNLIIKYWIECKKSSPEFSLVLPTLLTTLRNGSNAEIEWQVYDYFWNSFNEEDQIAIARSLMSRKNKYQLHQMDLFSKLNRNQLITLYSIEPVKIILNFMKSREFHMVRAAWRCVRLSISGPQFENIINTLADEAKKTGDCVDSLIDIWNSAPSTLIEYMVNEKKFQIAHNYFAINGHNFIRTGGFEIVAESLRFLAVVLTKAGSEVVKEYLAEKGPHLVCQYGTSVSDSLIQSSLSIIDQQEVKENILQNILKSDSSYKSKIIRKFRILCLEEREKLDEFVEFFTPKLDLQMKLKSKLIPSNMFDLKKGYFDANGWSNVCNLIDQIHPTENESHKVKKEIIFSTLKENHSPKLPLELCFRSNGDERFDELDQILTLALTQYEMVKFKEQIINSFRNQLFKHHCPFITHIRMDSFVHWCYSGNIQKMSRFKSRFPICKAFQLMFSKIVCEFTSPSGHCSSPDLFAPLDKLLCWKFPLKSQITGFKKNRLFEIVDGTESLGGCMWKNHDYIINKIIHWFFDGNETKIRNFDRAYGKHQKKRILESCGVIDISDGCEEYYGYRSDLSD